jgi:hypothetical protein
MDHIPDPVLVKNLVVLGIEPETSQSVAGNSDN